MWIMILWDIYIYILLCKQGLNQGKYGGPMGFNGVCMYIYIYIKRDIVGFHGMFHGIPWDTYQHYVDVFLATNMIPSRKQT